MRKEILSEIDQMKYLFGYKAGKVISEQVQPTSSGNVSQELKDLTDNLLDEIQNGKTYFTSKLLPNKIIYNPQFTFKPSTGVGSISYQEYIPSEKKSVGPTKIIQFTAPIMQNEKDIFSQKDKVKPLSIKNENFSTNPIDLAEFMFVVGADENPTIFADFIKNMDPKFLDYLKKSLISHFNSLTIEPIIGDSKPKLKQILDTISKAPQNVEPEFSSDYPSENNI
jgi:hypothetical protein